jgi:hypothetical protein
MTAAEQRILKRGVAAGILVGLGIGGIIALSIALRAGFLAALIG